MKKLDSLVKLDKYTTILNLLIVLATSFIYFTNNLLPKMWFVDIFKNIIVLGYLVIGSAYVVCINGFMLLLSKYLKAYNENKLVWYLYNIFNIVTLVVSSMLYKFYVVAIINIILFFVRLVILIRSIYEYKRDIK